MKFCESGLKTLNKCINRSLQIKAMYEAESWQRLVGLRCAGVVEGRDWGTCGAHQAECSCHEPDGQPCATVTAVK